MSVIVQDIIIIALTYGIATMGLSLVVGYAGIFVLSQGAIFGVGGFTYAILSTQGITSEMLIVLPIAMAIGGLLALLTALPSGRLRDDYYLVASLGFQIVIMQLLINWDKLSGGPPGLYALDLPTLGGSPIQTPEDMLYIIVPAAIVFLAITAWVVRAPYGRLLRGMADDELAVNTGGANTLWVKLGVFVFSGALGAAGGALYVAYLGVASPGDFSLDTSIAMISMVLVGGAGSLWGSVLGATLLATLPYWLNLTSLTDQSSYIANVIFGAVLVGVAFFSPDGIAGAARRLQDGRRRRAAPPDATAPRQASAGRSEQPSVPGGAA